MPDEWEAHRLGDLLRVRHGFAFKGEHFSSSPTGKVILTPGNFHENGGFRRIRGKEKYYTEDPPPEFVLRPGDLVVAMTEQSPGLLGSSALIPAGDEYLHNQRIGLVEIRDSSKLDRAFAYYLFNTSTVRLQIQATATGAKVRHTAPGRIEAVEVALPPLSMQRRIASSLMTYDRLIENNTRRIQILQEIAQATYREWFVEFRFPGHKGMTRVKSELGPIPEGWRVTRIDEIADLVRGRSYRGDEVVDEGGHPFINLKCVNRDGGFRVDGLKRYAGQFKEQQKVYPGDVVIAVTDMTQERRIIARAARVPAVLDGFGIMSMDLVKLLPHERVGRSYLLGVLGYSSFPDEVKNFANGANVLHLSPGRIAEYRFALPTARLRETYDAAASDLHSLSDSLLNANRDLRRTRDLLLPRLISGDVDVSGLDIDTSELVA